MQSSPHDGHGSRLNVENEYKHMQNGSEITIPVMTARLLRIL